MDLNFSLKFGAVFFSGLYYGWSSYCSIVEHPARIQSGTVTAIKQFKNGFKRVAIYQTIFSIIGGGSQFALYAITKKLPWLIGGASITLALPYTLFVMMPVNNIILDDKALEGVPDDKEQTQKLDGLTNQWGNRHWGRTILGLISAIIPVVMVLRN